MRNRDGMKIVSGDKYSDKSYVKGLAHIVSVRHVAPHKYMFRDRQAGTGETPWPANLFHALHNAHLYNGTCFVVLWFCTHCCSQKAQRCVKRSSSATPLRVLHTLNTTLSHCGDVQRIFRSTSRVCPTYL